MNSFDLNLSPPGSPPPVPRIVEVLNIDDDDDDDDVEIISLRTAFQGASSSRRTQGRTPVINVESVETSARNQAAPVAPPSPPPPPPPPSPPPPPPPPLICCPICMGPTVNETSTKCGHIFCESCIKTAISVQAKCPTCRRGVNFRELHRVYIFTN